MKAVRNNGEAFQFAAEALRDDRALYDVAVQTPCVASEPFLALAFASNRLKCEVLRELTEQKRVVESPEGSGTFVMAPVDVEKDP